MLYLRLFAPAIVLGLWAILWASGLRSDRLVGAFLVLITIAVVIAEVARIKRDRSGA